jgi:hypothetical protein
MSFVVQRATSVHVSMPLLLRCGSMIYYPAPPGASRPRGFSCMLASITTSPALSSSIAGMEESAFRLLVLTTLLGPAAPFIAWVRAGARSPIMSRRWLKWYFVAWIVLVGGGWGLWFVLSP